MAVIIIKGKPVNLSKEELRAMAVATCTVLEFHNRTTKRNLNQITIRVSKRDRIDTNKLTGRSTVGRAWCDRRMFTVVSRLDFQETLTTVIHEIIHLYFPHGGEKATSTLTSRLKPTVVKIYEQLVDGVYVRAGYIAHMKISYRAKGKDYYNSEQWNKVETKRAGYRKGGMQ